MQIVLEHVRNIAYQERDGGGRARGNLEQKLRREEAKILAYRGDYPRNSVYVRTAVKGGEEDSYFASLFMKRLPKKDKKRKRIANKESPEVPSLPPGDIREWGGDFCHFMTFSPPPCPSLSFLLLVCSKKCGLHAQQERKRRKKMKERGLCQKVEEEKTVCNRSGETAWD